MLRLAVVASLGFQGVGATPQCAASGTCKAETDDAAMMQLGKRSGIRSQAIRSNSTMKRGAGSSKPYFPPAGPAPKYTALKINEDGVINEYYLPGANITEDGSAVKYLPPWRFYLMKTGTTDYQNADNFYKPQFMGKTFTVEIDFGQDGAACGCNINFYLVDMPVTEAGEEGDYYCDAQCFVGKGCCAEFDMNEGNDRVQQVTNHACTGKGSYNGHPDWECNKWGDPEVKTVPSDFGPGQQHTINTNEAFTYSQVFDANGGDMIFTTTMSQNGRTKVLQMGPGNAQLNHMMTEGSLERGMAFVTGYWYASDMNWMDGDTCGSGAETCNQRPVTIRNWRITTNGAPIPFSPTPAPTPPTPPPPSPPTPESVGHCCWNGCSSCDDNPAAYCNSGSSACENECGGKWCGGV